jgi:hypothetical protein
MTQPGGRICGLPSRYRTYLRCSPILCAADAFSVLSQLAILCFYQKQRFLEAIGMILHERFNADEPSERQRGAEILDEDSEETESMQSLEAMTWLRWLWFILGTLPPAIKLMSMSGVRWEQVLGMMFLASWVINESLVICAASNNAFFTVSRTGRISWPGFEQITLSSKYRDFQVKVVPFQRWLALSALVVHTVILNGAFRVVFRKWRLDSSLSLSFRPRADYFLRNPSGGILSASAIFFTSICMLGLSALYSFLLRQLSLRSHGLLTFTSFNIFLLLVSIALNVHIVNVTGNASYSAEYVFGFTSFGLVAFLAFVSFLSSCSVVIGKNLLVVFPSTNEKGRSIDHEGFLSLAFFLATILAAILWYGNIYDPEGTVNPTWTGIFG